MAQRNHDDPGEIRKRLKATKATIDNAYIVMGRDLYTAFHKRLFLGWGHDSFADYVDEELNIGKKRAERVRRIWTHFIKECALRPSELSGLGYTNALQLLRHTDSGNARWRVQAAKKLTWRDLQKQCREWKAADEPPAPPDISPPPPPVEPVLDPNPPEPRTFQLYSSQRKVVDAAIDEAKRAKAKETSDGEALANVSTEFLASHMAKVGKPIVRLKFIVSALENVYGGRIVHIPNDEAADVLMEAMKARPDLFPDSHTPEGEDEDDD